MLPRIRLSFRAGRGIQFLIAILSGVFCRFWIPRQARNDGCLALTYPLQRGRMFAWSFTPTPEQTVFVFRTTFAFVISLFVISCATAPRPLPQFPLAETDRNAAATVRVNV